MVMTEDQEQALFVQWFRRQYSSVRIYAIPNGGARHPTVAAKMKATGTTAGVPDLHVPEWGLWIEMKRANGGRLSDVQKDWIAYLESIGHTVIIGHGWSDAMAKVQQLGFCPYKIIVDGC